MILEALLSATLDAGLGLLAEAGLGAPVRELREKLTKADEKQRRAAFDRAFAKARRAIVDEALQPLLEHQPFQEEVVTALLDPLTSFDVQAAAEVWGARLPEQALALRRFFNALQNALLEDAWWGPVLERYHSLRARQPGDERALARQVIAQHAGNDAIQIGQARDVKIEKHYHAPDPQRLEQERAEQARRSYLEKLRRHCQALPLAALGGEEGAEDEVTLDSVYIDLNTLLDIPKQALEAIRQGQKVDLAHAAAAKETPDEMRRMADEKDAVPLPVLEAITCTPRTVLLGDPGAGKSTFARKLLGLQAAVLLGECPAMPQIAPELLPVLIILRELAPRLQSLDLENGSAESRKRALLQVVSDYLQAGLGQVNAAGFATGLQAALERGAVLLVLDGLDEVPQDLRRRVRQVVSALIGEYRLERLIITSRIRSYTGEAVFPNLPAFTLRGFDKEQINRFVNAWYQARVESGHLRPNDKDRQVQDLVKAATSPDLREIASNPMMLTSMALIHQKEVGLPRERVRLYKLVVDVLIRRWQKYKLGEKGMAPSEALAAFLKDENRLLAALERLAYEAHQANKDQHAVADLPRKEALAILEAKEYLGHPGPAAEFLDYVDQRAGLLKGNGGELEKPTSYSFPHRTFQEYLAGCYLVRERSRSMARLYHQCAAEGDAWSVAAQLGAEELYYNRRSLHSMLDLAYQLCPTGQPGNLQQQRAALWSGNMARLAGPDEIGQDGDSPNGGPAYLERLRQALAAVLAGDLPPIERAEAGRALARVGDHRTAILTVEDIEFCFIPAGPFQMGIPQGPGDSDEQPQHEVVLPDYWIMRYPITNAQFNNFVTAGGYLEPRFWVEAASAKVWLDGKVVRRFVPDESWTVDVAEECESHPHDFGESFNLPNLPVVGISWYEALAFARWLNERLQAYARRKATSAVIWQKLAAGEIHIILPSEDEWEKAARGGDERLYPWGNAFNTNLANTSSTGLDSTCVVGCFPNGASPYGVLDMSGNVWEWTRSNYKKYPYKSGDGREELSVGRSIYRMVRGGSWFNGPQHARCTSRFGYTPDIPVF